MNARRYGALTLSVCAALLSVPVWSAPAPLSPAVRVERLTLSINTLFREGKDTEALALVENLKDLIAGEKQKAGKPPADQSEKPSAGLRSPTSLVLGGRKMAVHFGTSLIYLIGTDRILADSGDKYWASPAGSILIAEGGKQLVQNRYLKVGDETKEVQFSSSAPGVLAVDEKGSLSANGPGKAEITVAVGEASVRIPYTVVAIPVSHGTSQDEIVKALGLPDKRTRTFVGSFENDDLDGIDYYGGTDGSSIEHWFYNRYPGAILEFEGGDDLTGCTQLEWAKQTFLGIQLQY